MSAKAQMAMHSLLNENAGLPKLQLMTGSGPICQKLQKQLKKPT